MDPATLSTAARAGSNVLKTLSQPKIRMVRLGSREEKREVYSRFAAGAIALMHVRHEELMRMPVVKAARPDLTEAGVELQVIDATGSLRLSLRVEFAQAAFEVELIGTEPVVALADKVVEGMYELANLPLSCDYSTVYQISDRVTATITEFIAACRSELWYTPRWWQVHRRAAMVVGRLWSKRSPRGRGAPAGTEAITSGARSQAADE